MASDSIHKTPDPAAAYNQLFQNFQAQSSANLDRFLKNQEQILIAMENFSRNWFGRRHEATTRAIGAAHTAASSDTPADAVSAWREWFEGSAQRVMADLEDARAELARMTELHWSDAPDGKPNGASENGAARTRAPQRGKAQAGRLAA